MRVWIMEYQMQEIFGLLRQAEMALGRLAARNGDQDGFTISRDIRCLLERLRPVAATEKKAEPEA